MKYIQGLLLGATVFFFTACSESAPKEIEENPEKITIVEGDNTYGVELVDNKKWVIDKEMMVHIRNMESDVNNFSGKDSKAYDELGEKLDKNVDLLTSNCTMTGQGHDEMHKWLLPYIDLVEELNEAETVEQQEKSLEAIKVSFIELNKFFI